MNFKHFNEMSWPVPDEDLGEVAWRLRHSIAVSREDRLNAATVIDAYGELIRCNAERNSKQQLE